MKRTKPVPFCDVEEGEADMRILPLDHNSNHAGSRRA